MPDSSQALKPRWFRIAVAFGLICLLGATSGKPVMIVAGGALGLLGLLSFGWVSNWAMQHLKQDSSEFICALLWFGLWSAACALSGLPTGWTIFGIVMGLCGYMLLISKRDKITYEDLLNTEDPMERRRLAQRLRMQHMLEEFMHPYGR